MRHRGNAAIDAIGTGTKSPGAEPLKNRFLHPRTSLSGVCGSRFGTAVLTLSNVRFDEAGRDQARNNCGVNCVTLPRFIVPSCTVPGRCGVAFSPSETESLWRDFCLAECHHDGQDQGSVRRLRRAGSVAGPGPRREPEDGREMRKRTGVENLPMGPRERKSATISPLKEAAIVAFIVEGQPAARRRLKPSIRGLRRRVDCARLRSGVFFAGVGGACAGPCRARRYCRG